MSEQPARAQCLRLSERFFSFYSSSLLCYMYDFIIITLYSHVRFSAIVVELS